MKEDTMNIMSGFLKGVTAGGLVSHLTGVAKTTATFVFMGHPVTIPLTVACMIGGGAIGGLAARCFDVARYTMLATALRRMQSYES